MTTRDDILALQESLQGSYRPEQAVSAADAARAAALLKGAALKKGLTAGALHRLLEALAQAVD